MLHSFLMVGQSNMAGRGFLDQVTPIYNEKIQMLRNGRWQMMTEPINYDRPVAGVGLAASFADAWVLDNPEDTIGLIPCAEGGSAIEEWRTDGLLFRHAIAQAKMAMETSQLTAILWHQGESDSTAERKEGYQKKLTEVLQAFREALGLPHLPIIVGGLGDFLGQTGFGLSCTEHLAINQDIQRVADTLENCYYVTAAELTANPDGIHLDARSQRRFGLRYYHAFLTQQNQPDVLQDELKILELAAARPHTVNEQIYVASLEMALGKMTYPEFEKRIQTLYQK